MLSSLIQDIRATLRSIDRHALAVLLATPFLLTWQEFYANRHTFTRWFGDAPFGATSPLQIETLGWEWWSMNGLMVFVALPMAIIKLVLAEDPRNYGLRLGGEVLRKHAFIALGLYLLVLPFVISAAGTESFQATYPLFREARTSLPLLVHWWIIYLPQFFAVEFFFRGFILFGLERQIGPSAIFVSAIPYCMVHFHKPMPEAYGAIFAGVALGYVALRTRCIWSGLMVHVMVALTMDILAIWIAP